MNSRHLSPRLVAVLCSLALTWPVATLAQHTPLIEQAAPAKSKSSTTSPRRNSSPPHAPAPTPPAPTTIAPAAAMQAPSPANAAPPAPPTAPLVAPAVVATPATAHLPVTAQVEPVAPVHATRTAIGDTTRSVLRMQAQGTHAGRALPMLGETASRSYQRYLESFSHPIPEFFETTVPTSEGQSSGR
jgi:predicted component of type VI protein secretion system